MPDPYVLHHMEEAVVTIADAIVKGDRIGIVGDYDVDGATSTSILVRLFRMLGHEGVSWRIPHRIGDGYGPNRKIIDEMAEAGVSVLMIVDSGTAAIDVVAYARSRNITVIVIDHHEAHGTLPDCILVNPKRPDCDRSLDYLCTAGLAFLFAVGLRRHLRDIGRPGDIDLHSILGLVALGTVADVVPMIGLNRAYVASGLRHMATNTGIQALQEVTGEENFTPRTCGFVFGPCLNAAGRIADMSASVELLTTDDLATARRIATELHGLNEERRRIQKDAVESARSRIEALDEIPAAIVVEDPSWHPGVVGLIAARLKEAFDRPAIAIGRNGTGSCRSVEGFDIGQAIIAASGSGLLVKGGGHAMAAGLTIERERLSEFDSYMREAASDFTHPPIDVDLAFPCGSLSPATIAELSMLEPYGPGNLEPKMAVAGGVVSEVRVLKEAHIKVVLRSETGRSEAISFNCVGTPLGEGLRRSEGRHLDVYGRASVDRYAGREKVTLKIEDAMLG